MRYRAGPWPARLVALGGLLLAATSVCAQEYRLPFAGRWFVAQGGDTPNVNHHMSVRAQWYGIDFAKVGGPGERSLARGSGSTIEDFYAWGAEVLSPVDGEVIAVSDELPDNPIGVKDAVHPAGNHVVIKARTDRFVYLAHFRSKSVAVRPGQKVTRGEVLGLCGNSGNSDFPHIHMHVQDTPTFNAGTGQNIVFSGMNVELTGKQFQKVDWPVIAGLFVWNE
ncbi:MAG TPA: M23 family metallopeptidase [Usitatibacter sp.]